MLRGGQVGSAARGIMLKSMTGFGRATVEADGMQWTIEVQSVNSRFLDVQIRLPRTLAAAEFALRKAVGDSVARGKVSVSVTWEALPGQAATSMVNQSVAAAYVRQLRELQGQLGLGGEVSVDTLVGLPDLFAGSLESDDAEAREAALLAGLREALQALDTMRATEGAKLGQDMAARIAAIQSELDLLGKEADQFAVALAERVRERIQQLFGDLPLDPARLAQEAAFLAERADVTEERIRLAAHLGEFIEALRGGGQLGRRFNFLLQEMVRETNTIGSKTGELSVIRRVIKMKEELEKIREQVQNLE
jgi:uncharacterized protein (TIGR00255 family)